MKQLLTTTALVALAAMPLAAEQHAAAGDEMTEQSSADNSEMSFQTNMGTEIRVSTLMGHTVYAPREDDTTVSWSDITDVPDTWDDVADIDDVLISQEGEVASVLIDAGGFLGMGEKDVEIDLAELAFVPDNDDEGEYFIVYTGTKQLLEDSEAYDQAASETAGYTSTRDTMDGTGIMGGQTDTAMTDAESTAAPMARTDLQETDLSAVTTEELEGVRVYGSNDEWVGEIDTLVVGTDGEIAEVIVDVGGFLGLGEKPVAMTLDQITFMSSDGMMQDMAAYVDATEEELEGMPEWQEVN